VAGIILAVSYMSWLGAFCFQYQSWLRLCLFFVPFVAVVVFRCFVFFVAGNFSNLCFSYV
jgi:hypothetical protein